VSCHYTYMRGLVLPGRVVAWCAQPGAGWQLPRGPGWRIVRASAVGVELCHRQCLGDGGGLGGTRGGARRGYREEDRDRRRWSRCMAAGAVAGVPTVRSSGGQPLARSTGCEPAARWLGSSPWSWTKMNVPQPVAPVCLSGPSVVGGAGLRWLSCLPDRLRPAAVSVVPDGNPGGAHLRLTAGGVL
jgi:hypothetical protein